MWSSKTLFSATLLSCLFSCGGPVTQSKVAASIETLMANLIEGSFPALTGGTGGSAVDCSGGGTFQASNPSFGTIDPLNPSATSVSTPITFTKCVIKACGSTVTLDGTGTSIDMTLGDLTGISGATSNTVGITITVASQVMTGNIEGTVSFSYIMRATVSNKSLQSITIEDASPANPLVSGGKSYSGSDLVYLADGC
jgi:hypothetical protein